MTDSTDKPSDPFETAEFYSCNEDQETLTLESWEEAIAEVVEDLVVDHDNPAIGLCDAIRRHGPITVYASSAMKVSDSFVEGLADGALERIAESFSENYGDPDNYEHDFDEDAEKESMPVMVSAIRDYLSRARVWRCENVAERTFSPEEVETLMRNHEPDWFDPDWFDPPPEAIP